MSARTLFAALTAVALSGCGDGLSGGTAGTLKSDGNPLIDFRVAAVNGGGTTVATAVTRAGGTFVLVTPDAADSVVLPPGSYLFTVESVGSPVEIPPSYQSEEETPLVVDWDGEGEIALNIPGLKLPGGDAGSGR